MSTPAHAPVTVVCPHCGGTIELRAAGYSVNLGCVYCGSILDVSRPEVALIRKHDRAQARFAMDLGMRGTLFEREWAVVGAMRRKDNSGSWREYLLYNPYFGYRWLVEWEGEWQFGTMLLDLPEGDEDAVTWRGQRYERQWEQQVAVTGAVTGEFYWRVANGDRARCVSFERAGVTLSREEVDGEVTWTQLVPVDADAIKQAFGLDGRRMSRAPGRSSLAGKPLGVENDDLPYMMLAGLGVAIVTLLFMVFIAGPVDRIEGSVAAPYGETLEGVQIGTLEVRRDWQFVRVKARGREFDNRWVDLDYALVSRETGQATGGYGLVEHYSGRDSDGRWTEGDRRSNILLGRLPRGTYDVYVDAAAHVWPRDGVPINANGWIAAETLPVTIVAETGGLPWSNWLALVVLLFLWPGLIIWHRIRKS